MPETRPALDTAVAGVVRLLAWGLVFGLPLAGLAQNKKRLNIDLPTLVGFKAAIRTEGDREVGLVSGKEARPTAIPSHVQILEFRLETYRDSPDRVVELIIESPSGIFGPQGATSDQPLTLRSADDGFLIQGNGWSWDRSSGQLVISNAVRSSVRRTQAETNRPPVEIQSDRFEYGMKSGAARFLGRCEAIDPGRARVRAGELTSRLNPREPHPQAIAATNHVEIELQRKGHEGQVGGAAATYTQAPAGERIEVAGSSTWRFGPGEGAADELLLLPAQDSYTARGHARLKLAPTPPRPRSGAKPETARKTPPIEIECDSIEGTSTQVRFAGPVTARQTNQLELTAQRLVATLFNDPRTGEHLLQHAEATGDVRARIRMGADPIDLRGETMNYRLADIPTIEVRGQPTWHAADHQGAADLFVILPETPAFQAVDHVRVSWRRPGAATNAAPIEIEAARADVNDREARFTGGVTAAGSRWQMTAAELDLGLATNRVLQGIVARREVNLEYRLQPQEADTNAPPRLSLARLLGAATDAASRWRLSGGELRARLEPASGELSAVDLTDNVQVRNAALNAHGGRMTFDRSVDGMIRLLDSPHLQTADGGEIIGEPATALVVDPRTGRTGVEGAVRRMVFPARMLRMAASTNRTVRP